MTALLPRDSSPPDWWEERVPEAIRKQFHDLTDMLTCLNDQFGNREAALSFFWKVYDLSKKELLQSLEELDIMDNTGSLQQKLNTHLVERLKVSSKSVSDFFVYLHVAGAFLIALQTNERKLSNRFIEILDSVEKLCQFYQGEDEEFDEADPFDRSAHAVLALMAKWLFELRNHEGDWEEALGNLSQSIQFSQYSGFYIFADLDPQAPVNTFERLWDNPQKVKSWKALARYCREIGNEPAFYDPTVKWKQEDIQGIFFWGNAEGRCASRLSPSDAVEQKRLEDEQASETRLKNYFFYDIWECIPKPIQEKLKNIDRNWFSPGKRDFGDIVEELKVVTQDLIRVTLWDPFMEWIGGEGIDPDFYKEWQENRLKNYQPALLDFARMLERHRFREFCNKQVLPLDADQKYILRKLPGDLRGLNPIRRDRAHEPLQIYEREDVAPLVKKFFGIDKTGILPNLVRILKASGQYNCKE